jgi:hypothetical protein
MPPILAVHQTPSLTQAKYDEVVRRVTDGKERAESISDFPFEGLLVHATGQGQDGFWVVDVWASQEAVERFREAIAPVAAEVGIEEPPEFFPAHTFLLA